MKQLPAYFEPHQHSHAEVSAHITQLQDRIIELEVRLRELSKERDHWLNAHVSGGNL